MENSLILETTFLIDLERELTRNAPASAQSFLSANLDHSFYITYTVAGELAAGSSLGDRTRWEEFIGPFQVLACTKDVCWHYGKTYRYLQENGLLIGGNDLWIAATALAHNMPVVTRNSRHYHRIPGLHVVDYPK
jgi:tRNA(fMet)-specific endonuclease VapC